MPKLVALSEGYTGRSHELTVERTTVGRVEDNAFTIPEPSVSSHHCEILLKGNEVVVRDLDSTNGTFINDERITEGVLKPGQILRLGQMELRLESGTPGAASSSGKKAMDHTLVVPQGVRFGEAGGAPATVSDTATQMFKKKNQGSNRLIWIVVVVVVLVVVAIIILTLVTKL
jgi:pSer/pThr/pTyr-binding forkhead associated (FHA) protein